MDTNRIQTVCTWLRTMANTSNAISIPVANVDVVNIREGLLLISKDIEKENHIISAKLANIRENLFWVNQFGVQTINPFAFGQAITCLDLLLENERDSSCDMWSLIHPQIANVSKSLYMDGHYADAACDAFIEINDRVKKLFQKLRPGEKVPDGDTAMTTIFSPNAPLLKVCDISTDSGKNEQKGLMFMLQGAMSALRNPKAHANITITAEDAMRRLIFASMLMYKIDDAVSYSKITE